MKKGAVARIVVWSVTAFLLIGLLIAGILMGGWNFTLGLGGRYSNADSYSIGDASIADKIDEIEINWISGKVSIEKYDGDTLEISETTVDDEDNRMRYLVNNGKLTIQFRKSGWNFRFTDNTKKELTVKVPASLLDDMKTVKIDSVSASVKAEDIKADTFMLDSVSGSASLNGIETGRCDIDTTSGNIQINKLKAEELEFDSVSGDANVNGEIKNIDTDCISGKVTVETTVFPENITTDSVSGDVELRIPENGGFTADHDSVSGDFNTNLAMKNNGNNHIYGDGSANFDFDSVSGDVTIRLIES